MIRNRHLAKTAGISYFLGILLQFINHNAIHIRTIQLVILSVSMLMLFILLIENERILSRYSTDKYAAKTIIESSAKGNKHNILLYISIIVLVILMACLFSTLDSAVTLVHSDGIADIGQGARILLAFSGLAAGFIFDISNRKYTGIIMYCIMILSTLCIVLLEFSKPFVAVLIVFYLSAGFLLFSLHQNSWSFHSMSEYLSFGLEWGGLLTILLPLLLPALFYNCFHLIIIF